MLEDESSSEQARQLAEEQVWEGNVQLLEHEQRALVQPHFDRLSCAFARLISIGSATSFEVRGMRKEVGYFTSFYYYSLSRGIPRGARAGTWPRITRYDDRWPWIVTSVVPRFQRFDADAGLIQSSLQRIVNEARAYALTPASCRVIPDADAGTRMVARPDAGELVRLTGLHDVAQLGARRDAELGKGVVEVRSDGAR